MKKILVFLVVIFHASITEIIAQSQGNSQVPYNKIFAYGLDANIQPAISILDTISFDELNSKDSIFKHEFENRFKYESDLGTYDVSNERINALYGMFQSYWRKSMLHPEANFDGELAGQMLPFLLKNHSELKGKRPSRDSIGFYLSSFIRNEGLYTREKVDKLGRLYDLQLWETQYDTTMKVTLPNETFDIEAVFMEDFISFGWSGYGTLDNRIPGGWAEQNKLFCVRESYDLESEDFKVSFLAHEGRHLADTKLFPNLKSPDLEYRAKLTELSLAKETLLETIETFITDSNSESKNSHPLANYYVMHHLSQRFFTQEFCDDMNKWGKIKARKINAMANTLLKENTEKLNSMGVEVQRLINATKN